MFILYAFPLFIVHPFCLGNLDISLLGSPLFTSTSQPENLVIQLKNLAEHTTHLTFSALFKSCLSDFLSSFGLIIVFMIPFLLY